MPRWQRKQKTSQFLSLFVCACFVPTFILHIRDPFFRNEKLVSLITHKRIQARNIYLPSRYPFKSLFYFFHRTTTSNFWLKSWKIKNPRRNGRRHPFNPKGYCSLVCVLFHGVHLIKIWLIKKLPMLKIRIRWIFPGNKYQQNALCPTRWTHLSVL